MGIVNMMIVVPMILQTLSFGFVYKTFLGSNPGNAILFAGGLLLIAAFATMLIKTIQPNEESLVTPITGGH